jgi:ribosomal protein L20
MVASSALVALLLVVPSLAIPVALPTEPLAARDVVSMEEIAELAARDPNFFKSIARFAKKAVHVAMPVARVAAGVLLRREDIESEFSARDFEGLDLSERDLALLEDLAVRDPNFFKSIARFAKKAVHVAMPVARVAAGVLLRREDVEAEFSARDFEGLDLSERDMAVLQELAVRDPNFFKSIARFAKKAVHVAMPVARVAAGVLLRREDGFEDGLELTERDLEELEEFAAREPGLFDGIFNTVSNAVNKVSGAVGKVTSTVGKVSNTVGKVTNTVGKVSNTVNKASKTVAQAARKFPREEGEDDLSLRDLEEMEELDEVLAREYDLAMLD